MKTYYFKERKEVASFLEQFGFSKFIPALDKEVQKYYVETSEDKVLFCAVVTFSGDSITATCPFYDCDKAFKFKDKKEGEEEEREYNKIKDCIFEGWE